MISTLEQMQVPNGTGPGVRRSKRPLLARRTCCNVLPVWKPQKFGNKVKIGIKVQFGNKLEIIDCKAILKGINLNLVVAGKLMMFSDNSSSMSLSKRLHLYC